MNLPDRTTRTKTEDPGRDSYPSRAEVHFLIDKHEKWRPFNLSRCNNRLIMTTLFSLRGTGHSLSLRGASLFFNTARSVPGPGHSHYEAASLFSQRGAGHEFTLSARREPVLTGPCEERNTNCEERASSHTRILTAFGGSWEDSFF
jgi:hypothetical protein